MKKKLLLACLAFGMSASAQKKEIAVKGHYELEMYKYSKEYIEFYNMDWYGYFKNHVETQWKDGKWDYSGCSCFYWGPKYLMYNQDTIVLTYKFRDSEIYNNELYLQNGIYKIEKIAEKLWTITNAKN